MQIQTLKHRRLAFGQVHGKHPPFLPHRSSSRYHRRYAVKPRNTDLADRTVEYWDDEEDVQQAVDRLGLNDVQQGQDSNPLLSTVNKMYLKKTLPDGFLGSLNLQYIPGIHDNSTQSG